MKFLASQISYFLSQRQVRQNLQGLFQYLVALLAVIGFYAFLFHVIMLYAEGQEHSWITGIYWTLTVMSTLGFGDITFESDLGRAFSIVVLISGVILLLIMLPFTFIRFFYAPWLEAQIRLRAPRRAPPRINGHVIICNYDSITPGLIQRLKIQNIPYFVIEPEPTKAAHLHDDEVSTVTGDIDDRATYDRLEVGKASMVFANLDDVTNTNITVTVREASRDVSIACLVEGSDSVDVLELSGASHVVALKQRLGEQLANRVNAGRSCIHGIGTFKDQMVAEFPIQGTQFKGSSVREAQLRELTGVTIVAIWEKGKLLPVDPDRRLSETSVPVVIGTRGQMNRLETLAPSQRRSGPILVIGGGKVGRAVTRSLKRRGVRVHLIERKPGLKTKLEGIAAKLFIGDASDRDLLMQAGLLDAPSVVLTTNDDAMNIFLAIYCRRLHPQIQIISRSTYERNIVALQRAGADFVLSYSSLGVETVYALIQGRPPIILGAEAEFFEVPVPESLVDMTLSESEIGAKTGLIVVAVEEGENLTTNPPPNKTLTRDAKLAMVGNASQRRLFQRTFR